ncbi:MAG TPA: hypothetical protein VIT92_03650, partial [Burkholderiaceae bacterium]
MMTRELADSDDFFRDVTRFEARLARAIKRKLETTGRDSASIPGHDWLQRSANGFGVRTNEVRKALDESEAI